MCGCDKKVRSLVRKMQRKWENVDNFNFSFEVVTVSLAQYINILIYSLLHVCVFKCSLRHRNMNIHWFRKT